LVGFVNITKSWFYKKIKYCNDKTEYVGVVYAVRANAYASPFQIFDRIPYAFEVQKEHCQ